MVMIMVRVRIVEQVCGWDSTVWQCDRMDFSYWFTDRVVECGSRVPEILFQQSE